MRQVAVTLLIIALALPGFVFSGANLSRERTELQRREETGLIIPSPAAKIVALEYKGIFSDIVFFRALIFYGGKIIHKEPMTAEEWEWFRQNMELATEMDPYFLDPYYLGSMNIAWEAGKVAEANALLEKGFHARTWDWTIPFYLGFNYFYFLQDNEKAAHYLMEAAGRPGGSNSLAPTLAARLAHAGGRTESAVAFLEDILAKTDHEPTRYVYGLRLNALKRVLYLEKAVEHFRERLGRLPRHLDELVKQGVVREIPSDPYGGTFYLTPEGGVKTTSNFYVQHR
jgi:tetratricopeptide (TPR) repeat protein